MSQTPTQNPAPPTTGGTGAGKTEAGPGVLPHIPVTALELSVIVTQCMSRLASHKQQRGKTQISIEEAFLLLAEELRSYHRSLGTAHTALKPSSNPTTFPAKALPK